MPASREIGLLGAIRGGTVMHNIKMAVRTLDPVGAEITGLVPGSESDPGFARALYEAWLEYGILLFRNVSTAEQHIALSRCLGELEIHPVVKARAPEDPRFIEIGGSKLSPAIVFDEDHLRVNCVAWHRDTAFSVDICKGAMLRMLEIPDREGETLLGDTAAAYDDLPQDMKNRLATLEYKATFRYATTDERPGNIWSTARDATDEEVPGNSLRLAARDSKERLEEFPSVVHSAVITHPESGRKCLFISPTHADYFLGMDRAESDALLKQLVDHMTQPKYVFKQRWAVNDAVAWDNRRVIHAAVGNHPSYKRRGLRTTLTSDKRVGRFYDESIGPRSKPAIAVD
jgi:taurine dioxygenase